MALMVINMNLTQDIQGEKFIFSTEGTSAFPTAGRCF